MKNKKIFHKNINRIFLIFIIAVLAFFLRLLQIQVFGGDKYRSEAYKQRSSTIIVPAERGVIYDRNQNELAKTLHVYKLYFRGEGIDESERKEIAIKLSGILSDSPEEIQNRMNESTGLVASRLSPEQAEKIEALDIQPLSLVSEMQRFYPYGNAASYLLGFTDEENKGIYGVEKSFEDILKGVPGKSVGRKNLRGGRIPFETSVLYPPIPGDDIALTVDETIQSFVEEEGQKIMEDFRPKSVSILVSDPTNGEILAMQNFPAFDPNNPYKGRTEKENKELNELKDHYKTEKYYEMWRNIAVSDVYEPGSVFKMITAAAALEEHTSTDQSVYHCDGFITDIPGVTIRCISWMHPHGDESLEEALVNSCNPAFVQIARDLGKENMAKYIKDFGFGRETGIKLPGEEDGIAETDPDNIGEARLATNSYGHGIATTPIQMLTAANAVVNGGYIITPKVLLGTVEGDKIKTDSPDIKRQVISKSTSDKMRKMLFSVIEEGAKNVRIPGFTIGGKSGTSIKLVDGEYDSERTVSSFYGFFPVEDPKYSVLIVIDEPENGINGTAAAGPSVRNIFKNIIKYKEMEPEYSPEEKADAENITVPDVVGITLKDASKQITDLGLKTSVHTLTSDDTLIITGQYPEAGEKVEEHTVIYLDVDGTKTAMVKMPDLIGSDYRNMVKELDKLNLNFTLKSHDRGEVVKTVPESGVFIEPNSTVTVEFFDDETDTTEENDGQDDQDDETYENEENEEIHSEENGNVSEDGDSESNTE